MKILKILFAFVLALVAGRAAYIAMTDSHYLIMRNESMAPTLSNGQALEIDHGAYNETGPAKDDIVAFALAAEPNTLLISRVKAVPGDAVVDEITGEKNTLKPEEYFLIGDNLEKSIADSRRLGPIKREQIKGKIKVDVRSNGTT